MHIQVELLEQKDIEWVRLLRNSLRQHFFSTTSISRAQQLKWYKKYSTTRGYYFFTIKYNERPVGTISIRRQSYNPETYEIGNLMMNPAYQGEGFMSEAIKWLMSSIPNHFWTAHVKSTNTTSLRLFKRAGFWRVPQLKAPRRKHGN